MVYLSVQAKVVKDGKELDHWSEADPETLRKLLRLTESLVQEIDIEIFEKEHAEFMLEEQKKDLKDLMVEPW